MTHRVAVLFLMLFVSFLSATQRAESFNHPETVSSDQLPVQAIAVAPNNHIYAGTFGGGIYRSIDEGVTWVDWNADLLDRDVVVVDADSRGTVFVGTFGGGVYRNNNEAGWKRVSSGLQCEEIVSLKVGPHNDLYAGTSNGGIYYSGDDGETWNALGLSEKYVNAIAVSARGEIFAGTSGGIYASHDGGRTWSLTITGLRCRDVWALAVHQNGDLFAATNGGGIYRSIDQGKTWTQMNEGLASLNVGSLAICSNGNIFVGATAGVFYSTNNGSSWIRFDGDLASKFIRCLTVGRNGQVLTGMYKGSVLRRRPVEPLPEDLTDLYDQE
jgi:ligand-binding sensor domain-containing protein